MAVGLLVLSRDVSLVESLRRRFEDEFELVIADGLDVAQEKLARLSVGVALVHLDEEGFQSPSADEVCDRLTTILGTTPWYAVVDLSVSQTTRDVLRRRARACLSTPLDLDQVGAMLAHQIPDDLDPARFASGQPRRALTGASRNLVTFTPAMFPLIAELKAAASKNDAILLTGEAGSGKSYLASLLHELSPRSDRPLAVIACGRQLSQTVEQQLFGEDSPVAGVLRCGGTLLLRQVDGLTPDEQSSVLRLLESRELHSDIAGSNGVAAVRLMATTTRDLAAMVRGKQFHADLFARLSALSFTLPPLRERPWDIEYLARKFAIEQSRAHDIPLQQIEPAVFFALRQYTWPANIAELQEAMRRALVYSSRGTLTPADLPPIVRTTPASSLAKPVANGENGRSNWLTLDERVNEAERRIIEESLRRHNFHRIRTARELGISRVTLYNKMKKFGMLDV